MQAVRFASYWKDTVTMLIITGLIEQCAAHIPSGQHYCPVLSLAIQSQQYFKCCLQI